MDLLPRDVSTCRLRDNPAQFRRRDSRVFLEVVFDEVFDERGRHCQLEPRAGVRDVEDETEDAVFSRTEPHLERTAVVGAADVKSLGVAPGDSVGLLVLQRFARTNCATSFFEENLVSTGSIESDVSSRS